MGQQVTPLGEGLLPLTGQHSMFSPTLQTRCCGTLGLHTGDAGPSPYS